ncbi:transposase [Acerihabitans arboris]|uniref:Transposase n=1 Tax=Acerihabitans arboris TaxID=2691583 RepID=A0A845SGN9_9GAMM|nr:transposase [Acerihabitans arboris]NDL64030.1 transposase [Acerihabitans arboris]
MNNIYVFNSPITVNYPPDNITDVANNNEARITFPGHLCRWLRTADETMASHFLAVGNNTSPRLPITFNNWNKHTEHCRARNNSLARFSRFLAKIKPQGYPPPFKETAQQALAITRFSVIEKTGITYRTRFSLQQKMFFLHEAFRPGSSFIQVARRYGLQKSTLFSWRKRYAPTGGWESIINNEFALDRVSARVSSSHAVPGPVMPMDDCPSYHASRAKAGILPLSALFSRINQLKIHLRHRLKTNISLIKSIYHHTRDRELYRQQLHLDYRYGDQPRHKASRCVLCRLYTQYSHYFSYIPPAVRSPGSAIGTDEIFQHAALWHALSLKLIALLEHENDKLRILQREIAGPERDAKKDQDLPLDFSHPVSSRPLTMKTDFL